MFSNETSKFIVGPESTVKGKYALLTPGTIVTGADFDGPDGGLSGGGDTLLEFVRRGLILQSEGT